MRQLRPSASVHRSRRDAVQVARLAAKQHGAISRAQLSRCGLATATIARWIAAGRLHRVHRGVYAVGHPQLGCKGRLIAALIYSGRGSALSHSTGAWWWGLLEDEPTPIHVSAPHRRRSVPGVRIHRPRQLDPVHHHGLPVTGVARTLLDIATSLPRDRLRRAVAEADYRRLTNREALAEVLGRGHPGSSRLRAVLADHYPELAQTFSVLEERFLHLCEQYGIPRPEVNAKVCGLTVDALWREECVVVELDGHAAHATAAANERDRRRDLRLRSAGHMVLRYTWWQVTRDAASVAADVLSALGPNGPIRSI
jgi:predicted transcriptional regulator of viral defense system